MKDYKYNQFIRTPRHPKGKGKIKHPVNTWNKDFAKFYNKNVYNIRIKRKLGLSGNTNNLHKLRDCNRKIGHSIFSKKEVFGLIIVLIIVILSVGFVQSHASDKQTIQQTQQQLKSKDREIKKLKTKLQSKAAAKVLASQQVITPVVDAEPIVEPPSEPESIISYTANAYEPGQCVWGVKEWRPDIPGNWGNAYQWIGNAQAMGWPSGSTPRVGAVGVEGNHVVLITAVNLDGTVTTKEMNERYIPFEISSRTVSANYFYYIY